ncbi:MAG: hypothetical protein JSU68_08025 [Phycisphaerales bacterium]|nr:MAG: hypothetical protein JSU68_08025 [Phycisphaerales bacterium]
MLETVSEPQRALQAALREQFQQVRVDESVPWYIACAPGRLDVMGGISDYCGGPAVGLTLGRGTWVAAQQRDDQQVHITFARHEPGAASKTSTWALSNLYGPDGVRDPQDFASRIARLGDGWALPVAGVLHALLALGYVPNLGGGLTLAFRTELLASGGLGATAAAQVALMEALREIFDLDVSLERLSAVCHYASRPVCRLPSGNMDPPIILMGKPDALLPVNDAETEPLPVPAAICFWGVDSGVRHPLADQKQRQTRTASAMGARIISAIDAGARRSSSSRGLHLADITQFAYVSRYRDRLPTKMKGSEFLAHFGPLDADADPVEPDTVYKIRSRTEHHIYESQRCRQFTGLMRRAARAPHAHWLQSAGQLMNSSHWSYGQRCGLGTIETDVLVSLFQKGGIEQGVFGARISGAGAGGMVTVMASNNQRARDTVASIMEEYESRTGCKPVLYEPGGCGARQWGARRITAPEV